MFKTLGQWIDKAVQSVLVLTVFTMLLLSVISIILRWFGISFLWVEPVVRHLVFATAFLGATLATSTGRHIAIEILAKSLEASNKEKPLFLINKVTSFLTIIGLGWLFISGYGFLKMEVEYGKVAFLGIHSSVLVSIIPIGFALMFLRSVCDFFDFSKELKS